MHALIDRTLATVETASLDLAPRRFGRVVACDGGLIEVSGLGVPIGTICTIAQGAATEHHSLDLDEQGHRNFDKSDLGSRSHKPILEEQIRATLKRQEGGLESRS